jgi:hypothetical protein
MVDDEEFGSKEAKSPDAFEDLMSTVPEDSFLVAAIKIPAVPDAVAEIKSAVGRPLCEFSAPSQHKYATAWSLNSSLRKSPDRHDSAAIDTIAVTSNKVISLLDDCRRRSQFRRSESAEAFTRW